MRRPWLDEIRWRLGERLASVPGVLRYDGVSWLGHGAVYVNRIRSYYSGKCRKNRACACHPKREEKK